MPRQTVVDQDQQQRIRRRVALGHKIRALRGETMNQEELGAKLASASSKGDPVPQTTVSRWERGTVEMTLDQVYGIESAFDLPHGSLLVAAGYVELDRPQNVEDLLASDPAIAPELRDDLLTVYRTFKQTSSHLVPRRR